MGAIATVFLLLAAVPSEPAERIDAAGEARILVAPVSGLGLAPAVSEQIRTRLRNALRAVGARVISGRSVTVACSTDVVCARRKVTEARADGLVAVTALRVGATVQLTFRVIARASGEPEMDESLTVDVEGFPARDIFESQVRRLVEVLTPRRAPRPPPIRVVAADGPTRAEPTPVVPATAGASHLSRWLGLGASTALVAGGVTLLIVARADIAQVEDARPGTSWRDVESAYDRAPVLSGVGWALTGLGVVGGIASLLWLPLGDDARVAVGADPFVSGIAVVGQF